MKSSCRSAGGVFPGPVKRPSEMDEWRDCRTGGPKHLANLWVLTKGARTATCVLVGHPMGSELRVDVDSDLKRSEAFKNGADAILAADDWRARFEAKGWKG